MKNQRSVYFHKPFEEKATFTWKSACGVDFFHKKNKSTRTFTREIRVRYLTGNLKTAILLLKTPSVRRLLDVFVHDCAYTNISTQYISENMSDGAQNFDSSALNGLRGLVSVHIVIFHVVQQSFHISLYGQVKSKVLVYS